MNETVKDKIDALSKLETTTVIDYDWEAGILVINYGGVEDYLPETMDYDNIAVLVYTRDVGFKCCWDDNVWDIALIQNKLYVSIGFGSAEFESFLNVLKTLADNKDSYPDSDHITDEMIEKRKNLRKIVEALSKEVSK